MFFRSIGKGFLVIALTLLFVALIGNAVVLNRVSAASTLKSAAASKGKIFGTAVSNSHLGESQYASTIANQFSGVTPENEMKWDATEPSQNSFSFGAGDSIVRFAQSHGMKIRGHTLVWHSQLPGWVSNISSGSKLLSVMENHIKMVAGHFKGKIWYWDVVNEAFNGDGTRRSDVFQNKIGNAYIEDAFKTARATDPAAKLCYNDYSIDGINAKSTGVYNMVKDFKARGIPIDCVGFQSHMTVGGVPSDYQANLQRFASLGVDVNITELDDRASSSTLQQEATDYSKIISACVAVSRCTDITVWGVTDKYSWLGSSADGLLFDGNYNTKPAFNAVIKALGG